MSMLLRASLRTVRPGAGARGMGWPGVDLTDRLPVWLAGRGWGAGSHDPDV
jgi:hypothetical protein